MRVAHVEQGSLVTHARAIPGFSTAYGGIEQGSDFYILCQILNGLLSYRDDSLLNHTPGYISDAYKNECHQSSEQDKQSNLYHCE